MSSATRRVCHSFAGEQVFDSDDGGASGGDEDGGGGGDGDGVLYDKFGNVVDKAAVERAALQEAREAARAARAAKVGAGRKATVIGTPIGTYTGTQEFARALTWRRLYGRGSALVLFCMRLLA